MSIQPGRYEAKIINYDITEKQKSGDPQVAVLFGFNDQQGHPREYSWYGNLTHPVGREITLKALVTMGFTGRNISDLAGGIMDGKALLDVDTPVEIVIDHRVHGDKTYTEIKWVNRLGGAKWAGGMTRDQARVKLGALNLEGELAAIRAKEGQRPQVKAPDPQVYGGEDLSDLPF